MSLELDRKALWSLMELNREARWSAIAKLVTLKDRHNGNILIDKEGHSIHIDFGIVLIISPGSIGSEMALFKLAQDYIEDGKRHPSSSLSAGNELSRFHEFVELFRLSFKKIRKHAERIITISKLPCFGGNGDLVIKNLRDRFQLGLTSDDKLDEFIENKLVLASLNSVFTRLYDSLQYFNQGVL
ncbi:hypothetical protein PtB15_15B207 [Puccinia triticina]|nr:hypothetical protein PtB15_15B207 [Puccinia triticina]